MREVALVAVVALAVVGCGGDEQAAPPRTEHAADTLRLEHGSTAELRSGDGYTATVTFRRGDLQRVEQQVHGGIPAAACGANAERDALLPFSVLLENTTGNFDATPGVHVFARKPLSANPQVDAAYGAPGEPTCAELASDASQTFDHGEDQIVVVPAAPLPPRETHEVHGFLIAKGYYSPQAPDGDAEPFADVVLEFQPQTGGDGFSVIAQENLTDALAVKHATAFLPGTSGGCLLDPPCPPAFVVPGTDYVPDAPTTGPTDPEICEVTGACEDQEPTAGEAVMATGGLAGIILATAECDPGADEAVLHVLAVTIRCLNSGQAFVDPDLRFKNECIVRLGTDVLPISKLRGLRRGAEEIRAATVLLARVLRRERVRGADEVVLEALDDIPSLIRAAGDPAELLATVLTSQRFFRAVRRHLTTGRGRYPESLRRLDAVRTLTAEVLATISGLDDIEFCVEAFGTP